jgi:hypothetical protein
MQNDTPTTKATAALQRAQAKLDELEAGLESLQQQHKAGFVTFMVLLEAEGLIVFPNGVLRPGPCTLATFNAGEESDVRAAEIMDLFDQVERAELAVRAAAAVLLRQL